MKLVAKILFVIMFVFSIIVPTNLAQKNLAQEHRKYDYKIYYKNELRDYPLTVSATKIDYIDGFHINSKIKRVSNILKTVKIDKDYNLNIRIGEVVKESDVIAKKTEEDAITAILNGRFVKEELDGNERVLFFDVVDNYILEFSVGVEDIWLINKLNKNEYNELSYRDTHNLEGIKLQLCGYSYSDGRYLVQYKPKHFFSSLFNDYPIYYTYAKTIYEDIYLIPTYYIKRINEDGSVVLTYIVKFPNRNYEKQDIVIRDYFIKNSMLYIISYTEKYLPALGFVKDY